MITIANVRAEKAARKLAKQLDTTISEAVAVACERVLTERDAVTRGKRARSHLDRILADIWKHHKRPASPAERSRLANHSDLYGDDGLPR
jgi:hypothetical protein